MQVKEIPIDKVKENDRNPRKLTEERFNALKKSISDFPKMAVLRPLVLNAKGVVLGGNMRLKAYRELGWKKVPVVYANDLTPEEQQQFIVKDNVGFGEWDHDILAADFDVSQLLDFGLREFELGGIGKQDLVGMDKDGLAKSMDSYIDGNIKQIVIYFKNEDYETVLTRLDAVMKAEGLEDHTAAILKLLDVYENTRPEKEGA